MKPSELDRLDVAVIGAGYAGAAAAKMLSVLGCKVTVYEQAAEIREVGAGIGLRPSTLDRFRQCGILDAITAVSSPSDYLQVLTGRGEPILQEPWPEIDTFGITTHLIHRGDFIDALVSVLPVGMIKLGHAAEAISDEGDRATVTFTNGARITADLVVGADGIRSVIRRQLFSDREPVFAGEHAYRTVISVDDCYGLVADDNFRIFLGHGTKLYLLPLRHRGQVSYDITTLNGDSSWSPSVTQDTLVATVEGFDERIVRITGELNMAKVNARAAYDIDPIPAWHSDCVALVGDAAHAMLHHQGQGANSAILDVGALADALREADSVNAALTRYQAVRKPATDELQRISRRGWKEGEVDDAFPGQKPPFAGTGTGS